MEQAVGRSALHGRRVVIIADKDAAGREHAADVAMRLLNRAAEVRVLELPGPGKDASDWFDAGGTVDELLRLVEAARDAPPPTVPGQPNAEGSARPNIFIDTEEHRVVRETIAALTADHDLYQRGGILVRVIRDRQPSDGILRCDGSATIQAMPAANLRERMTRVATFTKLNRKGEEVAAHPAPWLVSAVEARAEWDGIRHLMGVSDTPILRPDGSIWQSPGYDQRSGVLFEPPPGASFPPIHPEVNIDDADAALTTLLEVVCDFPFESEEHRAAWVAALLTPLARFAFTGPSPLFLIDANVRGAGKGLLAQTIGRIVLGREMPVSERTLHRHRARAGLRIGDGRTVDLLRYVAWLVLERHRPRPEPEGLTGYEAHKERAAQRVRELSLVGRDIGELPAVANADRKEKAERDLRFFCEQYFPQTFHLPWSPDHLKVIAKIEQAVLEGGLFAMAMPRGSGKTSLCETACVWALVYGHREFVALIGSDEDHAENMLDSIKVELETNDLLHDDFPEVCFPIRVPEGIHQRAAGQLYQGKQTHIGWTAKEFVLPTIPGSRASGAIICVAGITGRIRGMKHKRVDGTSVRPSLVLIDDPQTDESARSPSQCAARERILAGAILGLAGPGRKIAGLMALTVVRPGDLADRILDREKHPQWQGERTKMVYSFPSNEALAVLGAAEQAALPSGVIYTDAAADAEASNVEPMDTVEMDRGTWLTMPYGWKINQVRAEQPTTVYGDFKHEIINEIARCLEIPLNVALGNSAEMNYASGRLDHQAFFKKIRIDQAYLGDVVLDRVLSAWLNEAVLIEGYLPQSLRTRDAEFPHQWFWDGFEHVDPAKEANAQATRLASNTTTLAAEFAKQGLDWESELRQRGREIALLRELGLTTEQATPATTSNDNTEDEGDVTEDEDARAAA